jgi:hypothetical protein
MVLSFIICFAGTPAACGQTKTHRRLPAMGYKNSVIRLLVQSPIAGVILVTTSCRHAAQIGRAARLGVQFQLAMKVFIRSKSWGQFNAPAFRVN